VTVRNISLPALIGSYSNSNTSYWPGLAGLNKVQYQRELHKVQAASTTGGSCYEKQAHGSVPLSCVFQVNDNEKSELHLTQLIRFIMH